MFSVVKRFFLMLTISLSFCLFSSIKVNAINTMSEFLSFEQAVIEINKDNDFLVSMNGKENLLLDEASEDNRENDNYVLQRLIVQGNLKSSYGASKVVSYKNLHILCYESPSQTQYAYKRLKQDQSLYVFSDQINSLNEYAEKNYSYSTYKNWGAETIDVVGYRQYLVDNNVNKQVIVVVMDTGINTSHPLFSNRLLKDDKGKLKGYSYVASTYKYSYSNLGFDTDDKNKYSFEDDEGHGSHVAGIIAGLTPNNVKILPIKIAGKNGTTTNSRIIAAYLRIIDIYSKRYNIVAVNLSFSGAGKDSEDAKESFNEQCYQPLLDLNILPITSAGNDSLENNIEGLKAVVVSALEKRDNQVGFDYSYSNYGKIVDISAPGTAINSAAIANQNGPSSAYVVNSGTSMAAPQVTAVAALLYLDPRLNSNFTALDIEKKLYEYSMDLGDPNKDIYYGEGMLNLKYFESTLSKEKLSFYKNDSYISNYKEYENFDNSFNLKMKINNSEFKIIYTTDNKIPTLASHLEYNGQLQINDTVYIYAMGIKLENGEIIERTKLYNISYFNAATPLDECFIMGEAYGQIIHYSCHHTNLVIPSQIDGVTVKALGPSLFTYANIESVTLPETVISIGGYVFQKARKLKYIYAPKVKKVFISAFSNTDSLRFVTDIHPGNNNTEGAYLPELEETIGYTFFGCDNLEWVKLSKLKTLGDSGYDFANCLKLKSVDLPGVTVLEMGTFQNCENLTGEFQIGEYVTSIKKCVFTGSNINYFTIHANNKNFYTDGLGVYSKTSIVAYAAGNEYVDYQILSNVKIAGVNYKITRLEELVLGNTKFNKLTIPESINYIGPWAANGSYIYHLIYDAKSASSEGYYIKEENGVFTIFGEIEILEIGKNVEKVPTHLTANVYYKTIIVNSGDTYFEESSLRRYADGSGNLDKIILNMDETVTYSFLDNFLNDTHIIMDHRADYLYIKNHPNSEKVILADRDDFFYLFKEGDYYVYIRRAIKQDNKISIETSKEGNGFISQEGIYYIEKGESKFYTFTPNKGNYISSIIVDGQSLAGDALQDAIKNGYEFKNVDENHTIFVKFEVIEYSITYKDLLGQTLTGLIPNSYVYGYGTTLANIEGNSDFYGWYDNDACTGKSIRHIHKFDAGDKIYYTCTSGIIISVEIVGDGSVVSSGSPFIKEGEDRNFIVQPAESSILKEIIIDGVYLNDDELEDVKKYGYMFKNIMTSHSIKVVFEKKKYTINAVLEGVGELTPKGNVIVEYGDSQTFRLSITKEYYVENIFVDGKELKREEINNVLLNGYTFTNVTSNKSIKIVVIDNTCLITVIKQGVGEIISTGSNKVIRGEDKRYTFKVSEEYIVSQVIIDGIYLEGEELENAILNGYTFENINVDHILKVVFSKKTFTIEVIVNACVDMTPKENVIVEYGDSQTFIIKETSGCQISGIYIGEIAQSKEKIAKILAEGYTFENVTKDNKIKVVARASVYTITASVEGKGLITPNGTSQVFYGNNYTYYFSPHTGYEVSEIIVDDKYLTDVELDNAINNGYTFKSIENNHTIKVVFEKNKYMINASFDGYGYILPKGNIVMEHGATQLFEIAPANGYYIKNIFIGSRALMPNEIEDVLENGYLFEATSSVNIRVMTGRLYSLKTSIEGGGQVSPSNNVSVKENDNHKLRFMPDEGYYVKSIEINDVNLSPEEINNVIDDGYIFERVNRDHKVKVVFAKKTFKISVSILGEGNFSSEKDLSMIEYFDEAIINIKPGKGYKVADVIIDDVKAKFSGNSITISKVQNDHIVLIVFEKSMETGMSCSKNGSSKITGGYDLLLMVFTLFGFTFYKKKIIK